MSFYAGDAQADRVRARIFQDMQEQNRSPSPQKMNALDDRFERLLLINEAMWSLLEERLGVSLEQLEQRVIEIDSRSGLIDGRRAIAPLIHCNKCDAAIDRKRQTCAFCGEPSPPISPFDRV